MPAAERGLRAEHDDRDEDTLADYLLQGLRGILVVAAMTWAFAAFSFLLAAATALVFG